MSKKFVVALNGTPNLRDPITEYLLGQNWRVWHWYADLWLLSEVPDFLSAGLLYEGIERAIPDMRVGNAIVLEMGPELRYYGRASKSDAWIWMMEHWGSPDIPPAAPLAKAVTPPVEAPKADGSS